MEGSRRLSLVVGLFVLASLAVLAGVVLTLSAESGLLQPRYTLVARFENVEGLLPGAPVHLAGKRVGRVASVEIEPGADPARPVRVELQIDRSVSSLVRRDSAATIGTLGLLGDKYVALTIGTDSAPVLRPGDEIATVTPLNLEAVAERGAEALDNVAELAENVNRVVSRLDEELARVELAESFAMFESLLREIREGEGLLHALIYDRYEGSGVARIERSLSILEDILAQIQQGEGILHSLIYESPAEQDVVVRAVQAGATLNSILLKVDRGEGTLGLLVNDPTLYEELKRFVGGARRSAVVRALLRLGGAGD